MSLEKYSMFLMGAIGAREAGGLTLHLAVRMRCRSEAQRHAARSGEETSPAGREPPRLPGFVAVA